MGWIQFVYMCSTIVGKYAWRCDTPTINEDMFACFLLKHAVSGSAHAVLSHFWETCKVLHLDQLQHQTPTAKTWALCTQMHAMSAAVPSCEWLHTVNTQTLNQPSQMITAQWLISSQVVVYRWDSISETSIPHIIQKRCQDYSHHVVMCDCV